MPANIPVKQNSSLVVELVGLAGAGKTTLSKALSQQNEKIIVDDDLELKKREHIPIFITNAPSLLPFYLLRCRRSRYFTWDEIKAMVYLEGWPRVLKNEARGGNTILLDHGAVFKLATLNAFGPARLRSRNMMPWWKKMFAQWSRTLDIIVSLHAPHTTLVERINTRDQRHVVKGKTEKEAVGFLTSYQRSYDQIEEQLTAHGGPKQLQFDTSQASIEQIVEEVLIHCISRRKNRSVI